MKKYLWIIGLLLVMSSSPCLADAGASIQLETTIINPNSGGVYIPTFSTGGYDFTYTETTAPIVTTPPVIQQVPPAVISPVITPPAIITTPSESITPTQPLPIEVNTVSSWNNILIIVLGIVGITLLILGFKRRNSQT